MARGKERNPASVGIACMIVCALLWSTGGLLMKLLPWNPLVIAGTRSLLASGIFLIYMHHQGLRVVFTKTTFLVGASMALNFTCFVTANKLTTAANAIILQNTNPIFIVLLSALVFHTTFSRRELFAVGSCLFGILLFFFDSLTPGGLAGNLLALFTGVLMSVMFILSARAESEEESTSGIFWGHTFTALVGLPFALLEPPVLTPVTITAALLLGIFQIGIPYVLYGIAIRRCDPLNCSLIAMLEPLLNPVWVFLAMGERPGLMALAGGVIVIGTVVWWCLSAAALAKQEARVQKAEAEN